MTLNETVMQRITDRIKDIDPPRHGKVQVMVELNYADGGLGSVNVEANTKASFKGADIQKTLRAL